MNFPPEYDPEGPDPITKLLWFAVICIGIVILALLVAR